jgi:hypothetical protein
MRKGASSIGDRGQEVDGSNPIAPTLNLKGSLGVNLKRIYYSALFGGLLH